MKDSKHYNGDRQLRETIIRAIGYGHTIKSKLVDRGHKNGPEIHEVSDTGIVTIYNAATHKMVTRLIARPAQIVRYFERGERVPEETMAKARHHEAMKWNEAQGGFKDGLERIGEGLLE